VKCVAALRFFLLAHVMLVFTGISYSKEIKYLTGKFEIVTLREIDSKKKTNSLTLDEVPFDKMFEKRKSYATTVLGDGRLLVTGGYSEDRWTKRLASTEIWDPKKNMWEKSFDMINGRACHTATLLSNGEVLIVGGDTSQAGTVEHAPSASSAILFNLISGECRYAGSMPERRCDHEAVLLENDRVLIRGGIEPNNSSSRTHLVWEPAGNKEVLRNNLLFPRAFAASLLLKDGAIMVSGGTLDGAITNTVEKWDSNKRLWQRLPPMISKRSNHQMIELGRGQVLAVGGDFVHFSWSGEHITISCELWNNEKNVWEVIPELEMSGKKIKEMLQRFHDVSIPGDALKIHAVMVNENEVLFVWEYALESGFYAQLTDFSIKNRMFLWNAITRKITELVPPDKLRTGFALSKLIDGRVLFAGGSEASIATYHSDDEGDSQTIEYKGVTRSLLWDRNSPQMLLTSTMPYPCMGHNSVSLHDGRVMLVGGKSENHEDSKAVAIYDPLIDSWSIGKEFNFDKPNLKSVVVSDRTVFIFADEYEDPHPNMCEVYNLSHNEWITVKPFAVRHGVAYLCPQTGKVMILGGLDRTFSRYRAETNLVEIWDEADQKWSDF
jgi:hypothetical protein